MSRPCGLGCAKAFLVIINLVFLLCGGAMLGLGIWVLVDQSAVGYMQILQASPTGPMMNVFAYTFIGVGGFITLLSFLGCCGAWAESTCFLCLYLLLMFLILLGEIICAILVAVFRENIGHTMEATMQHQVIHQYNRSEDRNNTDPISLAWDAMQVNLHCCGGRSPQDFRLSYWFNHTKSGTGMFVPPTCCVLDNDDPINPIMHNENRCEIDAILYPESRDISEALNVRGCYETVLQVIEDNLLYVILANCGIFILQLLNFIMACCLMNCIRKEQSKYPWYIDED